MNRLLIPGMLKPLFALAAMAVLVPATAPGARFVGAPLAGTAALPSGAVKLSGGTCGSTPLNTGVTGSLSWNVVINTPSTLCFTAMTGAQNVARHTFADGYTFRLRYFNRTAQTYDRTCDRCNIGAAGDAGIPAGSVQLQRDKSGTLDTSWYAGYTNPGEFLSAGELTGYLD